MEKRGLLKNIGKEEIMKPDLQTEQNNVKKFLENHGTLKSIYKELRSKSRFQLTGDYPIIAFICNIAKKEGFELNKKEIVETLKITQDGEFKRVREDSEIVRQLCV